MQITLLGTRGLIPLSSPRHARHSGLLVDDRVLFDLGEKEFLRPGLEAIFITHFHPDHAIFVKEPLRINVPLYAIEAGHGAKVLQGPVRVGGLTVTALPVSHSLRVKACAYLIESGTARVLYTGDLFGMDGRYRRRLGRLDTVVMEASFLRNGGLTKKDPVTGQLYGHSGIPEIIRMFRPHTKNFVLTHFGSWFLRNEQRGQEDLGALAQKLGVRIIIGQDGMKLKVPLL